MVILPTNKCSTNVIQRFLRILITMPFLLYSLSSHQGIKKYRWTISGRLGMNLKIVNLKLPKPKEN